MSIKIIWPEGRLAQLTQFEAEIITRSSQDKEIYSLYRSCSLAVLNCGSITDNARLLLDRSQDFDIEVIRNERGLKLELINPPESAFIDGEILTAIKRHLFAVLRDIVQIKLHSEELARIFDRNHIPSGQRSANHIFSILRNADALQSSDMPRIAVCWGGHAIPQDEYDYAYRVGYELGLRKIDICTGCGPGIMEAPMKGALMGQSMQDSHMGRRIGLTEPSIIMCEPPNAMISELVILPDIEKRLEAFVRLGHALIAFPGGPGTIEELLFILAIRLNDENRGDPLPLILTGGEQNRDYLMSIDAFFRQCFGDEIARCYSIIIDDPKAVATRVKEGIKDVYDHRTLTHDSYSFNWNLCIDEELSRPFEATHESMEALRLYHSEAPADLAIALRRAFSGIVAGNVKEQGVRQVRERGPFRLHGDRDIVEGIGKLLEAFERAKRFSIGNRHYEPCYVICPD